MAAVLVCGPGPEDLVTGEGELVDQVGVVPVDQADPVLSVHRVRITYADGGQDVYLVPLSWRDHSVEELSEMTGMNENTVKVKLFRARQKLVKAAQRLDRAPGLVPG